MPTGEGQRHVVDASRDECKSLDETLGVLYVLVVRREEDVTSVDAEPPA